MATPAPNPTRQQLDDLDALLQRMLALPVNPAEGPPPELVAAPQAAPAFEPLTPPPGNVILSDLAPAPAPPAPAPPASAPRPPAQSVPLPLLNPVPPPERRAPVLPAPERRLSPHEALVASRPPQAPLPLRPILWVNRLFDRAAFALGPAGRWLRRPSGCALLGTAGLLLLAAAAALALLGRFGWTR